MHWSGTTATAGSLFNSGLFFLFMPMELVSQALIGLLVLGGLAFHERVVNRLASLDTNSDLVIPDEKE